MLHAKTFEFRKKVLFLVKIFVFLVSVSVLQASTFESEIYFFEKCIFKVPVLAPRFKKKSCIIGILTFLGSKVKIDR